MQPKGMIVYSKQCANCSKVFSSGPRKSYNRFKNRVYCSSSCNFTYLKKVNDLLRIHVNKTLKKETKFYTTEDPGEYRVGKEPIELLTPAELFEVLRI